MVIIIIIIIINIIIISSSISQEISGTVDPWISNPWSKRKSLIPFLIPKGNPSFQKEIPDPIPYSKGKSLTPKGNPSFQRENPRFHSLLPKVHEAPDGAWHLPLQLHEAAASGSPAKQNNNEYK